MNGKIKNLTGATIIAESGTKYTLKEQIGYGAQGVVYEENSGKFMVKLYYPSNCQSLDEDMVEKLNFIRDVKMPKNFVSIIDVITSPYVGYVMEKVSNHHSLNSYLIPDESSSFSEWYNRGLGLYERIFIGYIIAKAFGELEKNNLSYCDISGNNILVRTGKSASVKMIDVDNIYIAGKGKATVLGTPRYIAPEVISRQKNPDVLSDNYSLAVILFELLRVGHPYISDDILDGTPEDEEMALAGNVDYVNDENSSNMLPTSVTLTESLKELFERCFVDGKKNRLKRPSATEFEYALLDASNKLVKCQSCGAWHYLRKKGKDFEECPWCDAPSHDTARINFYDILYEGEDYKNAVVINKKLVNSYVLKESRKNNIKSLYVLRYDDLGKEKRSSENYLTIANNENGYHIYNEFCKKGIVVKQYGKTEYMNIENNKALKLNSGDEIYFEIKDNAAIEIECGGKPYSFIRMARFMEV